MRTTSQSRQVSPTSAPYPRFGSFNPADRFAKHALNLGRARSRKAEFSGQRRQLRTPDWRKGEDGWEIMCRTLTKNTPGGGARSRIVELTESFDHQNIEHIA